MEATGGRDSARIVFALLVLGVIVAGLIAASYHPSSTATSNSGSSTATGGTSSGGGSSSISTSSNCSAGSAYDSDWLTFKDDSQRTGFSSYDFSASPGGRFAGQLAWHNDNGFSEMVATQGELFFASYWLFAIGLADGSNLWNQTTGAGPAPPLASNGTEVYLGSNLSGLVKFDPSTGANSQTGDVDTFGTVAICGDMAYVNSEAGQFQNGPPSDSLQALNLTSGQTLWSDNLSTGYFVGYPTTDGHLIYTEMDNGTVFAFRAASVALAWRQTIPLVNVTTATTSTGPNGTRTIVGNINAADYLVETPPLSGGELYVTTTFGMMYALNATTGNIVWSTNLGTTVTDPRGSSAVAYGTVFEGTAAGLIAVNATDGSIVWKAPLNSTDTGTPTVVDGYVFIADFSGTLYQFDATTGRLLWSYTGLGNGYVSEPIVAGGLVCVDGNKGVFAFH